MKNNKMYNFIEGRLGEPLSNKEKKRLGKLAEQREKEKAYAFMEQHLGEPLTAQDKAKLGKWEKASAKYDIAKANPQSVKNYIWKPQQGFLWRYGVTAIASIILCLSIVLPITLGNTKSVPYPVYIDNTPPVEIPRYTDNIQSLELVQGRLKSIDGLLLFSDEQYFFNPANMDEIYYGITKVESSKKDGRTLGYLIDNCSITINLDIANFPPQTIEVFEADYRIRTYKHYFFEDYYQSYYATLEKVYNDYKADITDENNLYDDFGEIKKVNDPDKAQDNLDIDIFAFVHNDIKVFFTIELGVTFIYFEYNGNDYFIKAMPVDFSAITGKEFTPDANYIKDEFIIKTLFANLSKV